MSTGKTAAVKRTVVEAETELRGTLSSTCHVVVLGRIDGDVAAPAVEIAETGVVSGKLKAGQVSSRGELAGLVEADTLSLSGRVRDGTVIRTGSLDVRLAPETASADVVAFGDCQLDVGEPPSKDAAIRRARGLPEPEAGDAGRAALATEEGAAIPQPVANEASGGRSGRRRAQHDRSGETGA